MPKSQFLEEIEKQQKVNKNVYFMQNSQLRLMPNPGLIGGCQGLRFPTPVVSTNGSENMHHIKLLNQQMNTF